MGRWCLALQPEFDDFNGTCEDFSVSWSLQEAIDLMHVLLTLSFDFGCDYSKGFQNVGSERDKNK